MNARVVEVERLVAEGVPVRTACKRVGMARSTYYEQRRVGVVVLPSARAATPPSADSSPPTREELLALLAAQARRGSVRAIELLLREMPNPNPMADGPEWARVMSLVRPEEPA